MATLTTSTFDPILKEFYLPLFEEQFDRQMVLMDEVIMKRDTEHVEGKNAFIAIEWENWAGTGSRAEEENFPDPQPGRYARTSIPMRYHYAAFRVTGQVLEASRSDPGAFAPAIQREMKSKITAFHKQHNRMMWGDGSGALCQVDGNPTTSAITVDNAYGIANDINGHMFFSPNVKIDIYSAKTGGAYRGTYKVTAVAKGSGTATSAILTVDSDAAADGVVNGDLIFLEGSRQNELMGLIGIIDAGNFVTTIQGLNNATSGEEDWAAQIHQGATAGTNEALSLLRMMGLWNDIAFTGTGTTAAIIGSVNMQLTYAMMAKNEGIQVNRSRLNAAPWEGLDFQGLTTVLADKYAPPNRFAFVDPSTLRMYEMARPQWLDRGTGVLQRVGRTDVYEAIYFHYAEVGVSRRMANGMLEDVTELSVSG